MTHKTIDDFIRDNFSVEIQTSVEVETQLARVAVQAAELVQRSGLTRRELAARMGAASPSTVQRMIAGGEPLYNPTIETLVRLVIACGRRPEINLVHNGGAGRFQADIHRMSDWSDDDPGTDEAYSIAA